jgi:hypothetical protein
MKPLLLRLAGTLAVIQGAAHGTLIAIAQPRHGDEEVAVVEAMRTHAFDFGGAVHSYWEMYFGYAMMVAGTCVAEGVLLWLLAPLAKAEPRRLRPVLLLLVAANVGHAALVLRYFFPLPLVFDALVALCLLLAIPGREAVKGLGQEVDHHARLGV